jgi:hypothetical protein
MSKLGQKLIQAAKEGVAIARHMKARDQRRQNQPLNAALVVSIRCKSVALGSRAVSSARMSALGHKRTLKRFRLMSALPPKADMG